MTKQRTVTITKKPDEEFEFFLRKNSDGTQVLTRITKGGPADRAGAKNEDKLVEVNGVNVEGKSHEDVVSMIKASVPDNSVTFVVVATEEEEPAASTSKAAVSEPENDLRPRICKVEKRRNTFGFFLMYGKHNAKEPAGHFIKEIVELGAAADSGLNVGDRVIAVGKHNVEALSHEKTVGLIKESGNKVALLVVDSATYQHFKKTGQKITAKHAISSSDSVVSGTSSTRSSIKSSTAPTVIPKTGAVGQPRQVHLIKDTKDGYGFYLRCKLLQKDPVVTEEFVGDLEKGKSGDLCGLKENDIILSVNGECIQEKTHDAVVELIRSNANHSVFIVIPSDSKKDIKMSGSQERMIKLHREKPKVIDLNRSPGGYGFTLRYAKNDGVSRHMFTDIESDTPAQQSGLQNDDILIAVNDSWVINESHELTIDKIKSSGDAVKLVVSSDNATVKILSKLTLGDVHDVVGTWPKDACFMYPWTDNETGEQEYASVYKPRLCRLVKGSKGYGFFLRDEDGAHILDRVDSGLPADEAGVKNGDFVIEVNGENVEKCSHEEIVAKIRSNSDGVDFLVVDSAAKAFFESKGKPISATLLAKQAEEKAEDNEVVPEPRLCHLVKDYGQSFEFHMNSETKTDNPGQFIRRVTENGIAANAGLKNGDRVICINGENIEDKSHEDVVGMIRGSGNEVTFLVVDEEADTYFKGKGIKITAALIVAKEVAEEHDNDSSSTTVVEAEATVHDEPKESPVIDFPPPPADAPDAVAEALEEIQEAVEDEDATAEDIKEAVEDAAETIVAAKVADAVVDAIEEAKEEEEVKEEIAEEFKEEIAEEVKDEIAEEVREEIAEAVVEAAIEDKVEDAAEELREEIREEIVEAVIEEKIEDAVEDIKEEVKEAIVDEIKEEIQDAAEDSDPPPSTFLGEILSAKQLKATPPVEENAKKEFPNEYGVTKDEIINAKLKPIDKVEDEQPIVQNGVNEDVHNPAPKPKFSVRSARAMFEQPDATPVKRNWTRQPSKANNVPNGGVKAAPETRKLFTQTSAMKFNIVESSASFR